MKTISISEAARRIESAPDKIWILTHKNPDGDTLGSAFALWGFLRSRGKRAAVLCPDEIGPLYRLMTESYVADEFEPNYIITVDCADRYRTISNLPREVDLAIDHHETNDGYANETCLVEYASAAEAVLLILEEIKAEITPYIADCLYIGISTDTGCFKFMNTTAETHIAAAKVIAAGAQTALINRMFFRTKTRTRIALEAECLRGLEYRFDGKIAFFSLRREFLDASGVTPDDYEGLAAIPITFEGVEVGVVIREQSNDTKVSIRTHTVDATAICREFGGGGHFRASGFETTTMTFDEIKDAIEKLVRKQLQDR